MKKLLATFTLFCFNIINLQAMSKIDFENLPPKKRYTNKIRSQGEQIIIKRKKPFKKRVRKRFYPKKRPRNKRVNYKIIEMNHNHILIKIDNSYNQKEDVDIISDDILVLT